MSRLRSKLEGQKFGRWIVIQLADRDKNGNIYWLCKCVCGKEKRVRYSHLQSGASKSCGCLRTEKLIKHGQAKTKTYKSWGSIIQRCTNPNHVSYHNCGGRGIKVCKHWLKFENFLEDMGEVPEGYQIDRIDNNKGYCKENCRWATRKEQQRNKRNNLYFTYKNKTQLLIEWAEEFQIPYHILKNRIRLGWSMQKALTTLVRKYKKRLS